MKILALDASGKVASVALAENDKLLGEYTSNTGQTHSQTLLPMVDALQRLTGVELSGVDAIAVAAGPGSF
ncbi:MAG: tRNA (adenosine(37)-N6)-threonylcarbamoyltransferase complex dimerization subunit type 1 TsaB, partial [Lachnospiraceae bacterium]|nr:tRNA (adenosine(37)-N6)-threonylcarbamoyltransferase complex dimerization subunit type 1 TsaB [Lachnospiraceae bacterium]